MLTKFGLQRLRQEEQTEPSAVLAFVNALTLPPQMGRIRHVLNQVEEDYDYCIIDCHPGVGIEVLNALAAAEDIIIPIKADKNALDGIQ